MLRVHLQDFRCFARLGPIELKPITFLVGENSAGKTSFLAAVRQLFQTFTRTQQNPFNREPYFLGGFDQIAHYRGGRAGRAKTFKLSLEVPGVIGKVPGLNRRFPRRATLHSFTFARGAPQPELICYEFDLLKLSLRLALEAQQATVDLQQAGGRSIRLRPKRLPPSASLRKDLSYLRFILDEINFSPDLFDSASEEDLAMLKAFTSEQSGESLYHAFALSSRFLNQSVFASAPVRTEPLRTYTPSELVPSAEGAHVPLEMARQKTSAPKDWTTVHDRLARFGKNAGLFDDIDIRLLGKRDGDPFQVTVKMGGPSVNLVDVGYGVSQALPIVYQLQQSSLYDAFLLQQPEVHLHPRAQAELGTLIAQLSKQRPRSTYVVETHSDYIIDRLRMEVAKGTVDHRAVSIVYFRRHLNEVLADNIYLSENGEIEDPPDGFRDFFLKEHARLLGL